MKIFLVIIVTLMVDWIRITRCQQLDSGDGNNVSINSRTGFACYARCLAKCVEEKGGVLDTACKEQCSSFNSDNLCAPEDESCWSTCNKLILQKGVLPEVPVEVSVHYVTVPEPTPHEANLTWRKSQHASLYFVQYADKTAPIEKWSSGNMTTSTNWIFAKPNLCPEYGLRIAAVNQHGISNFSDVVVLREPVPVLTNISYKLLSLKLSKSPFIDDFSKQQLSNTTIRAVISFAAPPAWNLSTEIEHVKPNVHIYNMQLKNPSSVAPQIWRTHGEPIFEILLPGDLLFEDPEPQGFMFSVDELYTTCHPQRRLNYLDLLANETLKTQTSTSLVVSFTCEDLGLCGKPKRRQPECNYGRLHATFECVNSTVVNATFHFPSNDTAVSNGTILRYVVRLGQVDPLQIEGPLGVVAPHLINVIEVFNVEGDQVTFTWPGLQVGLAYSSQFCAITQEDTDDLIQWNLTLVTPIDLTDTNRAPMCHQLEAGSSTALTVSVSIVGAVLLLSILVTGVVCWKCANRPKSIDQLATWDTKMHGLDSIHNEYRELHKRYDHWEIPRSQLQIFEDQKLGSGAFGSVYKGQLTGMAVMHKHSQSILAENRLKAENCVVAVKMVPEFADETAKSEFRKEINLMKQLGSHERLVNMICCVTADEPICLIVEYCSEGDLLHYLRQRCKYMVKLQENGVDLNALADNHDVDLDHILSLKDLLAFAWQISVGLEYLSEKNYIHRDVAARNILVDKGKRAKIGDFGLCRFSCSDPIYMSKGGRLPWKWMAVEAIRNFEFTTKSDVWSYGVLLFEIITLGGSPYPGVEPTTMEQYLNDGNRLAQPDNCPDELYALMRQCWLADPDSRPPFSQLRESLRKQLEHITEDYSYMRLNQTRDYYNAVVAGQYEGDKPLVDTFAAGATSLDSDRLDDTRNYENARQPLQNPPENPLEPKAHAPVTKANSCPYVQNGSSPISMVDKNQLFDAVSLHSSDQDMGFSEHATRLNKEFADSDQMLIAPCTPVSRSNDDRFFTQKNHSGKNFKGNILRTNPSFSQEDFSSAEPTTVSTMGFS